MLWECLLLLFSHLVMSNSLWPQWLKHTRLPCPSLSPGVCSDSCPLSWWCHPTISTSVAPSPPAFNLSQHQGLFQWVNSSHEVAKVLEFQPHHQSFRWIFRTDFLLDWLVWSPICPRDAQESSPTPQFRSINSSVLSFLYDPTLTSIHDYWKNHSFTRQTFVGKVMSLLFNMLSRLAIAFLPRSKCLLEVTILSCMHAQLLSHVWLFTTPWTVAHQALLSMEFSRQE